MTDSKSFMGIPLDGDINHGRHKTEQKPMEQLVPLIQAVLDQPDVLRFGFTQYTPYFNDGDPCYFTVHPLWADPVNTAEDDDYYHEEVSYDERWGKREISWDHTTHTRSYGPYTGDHESAYLALVALSEAIETGAFDDALLDAFGDHVEVVFTKDRISLNVYEHD